MTDQLKHPAVIIAGINSVVLAGSIYYVYQQISGLKNTVAELERQLAGLKLTLATIKEQDVNKAKLVRETNEKVNSISTKATEEIEALNSYIAAMNTDLHGLADQLNSNGIQVELFSVSSAVSNYQGEMHFPSQYQGQFTPPTYGSSPASPASTGRQHHSAAGLSGPNMAHNHMVMPGSSKVPGSGAGHMTMNRLPYQHPPMQMRMANGGTRPGFAPNMMAPSKPKDPDPIGDIVDLAQSQPEQN